MLKEMLWVLNTVKNKIELGKRERGINHHIDITSRFKSSSLLISLCSALLCAVLFAIAYLAIIIYQSSCFEITVSLILWQKLCVFIIFAFG